MKKKSFNLKIYIILIALFIFSSSTVYADTNITSNKYKISDKFITKISIGETIENLLQNISKDNSIECKIYNENNEETNNSDFIITGMKLKVGNKDYILITFGDINKDGKLTALDLSLSKKTIIGLHDLDEISKKALDINEDDKITALDLSNLCKLLVELKIDTKNPSNNFNSKDFSTSFLKLENNNKNMIYSPLSIKYALNMLNEGASGNTRAQVENIIKNSSLTKYNNIDNILALANAIYIKDDYREYIKENYRQNIANKYNAEINYDSFNNANNINNWIENKTLGIIKNILRNDSIKDAKTLLINALAIDMAWASEFNPQTTSGRDFYLSNGNTIKATTMNEFRTFSDNISYYKDENITSLTMDLQKYNDTQLEFTAIMPNNNLPDYIKNFTIDKFNNIREKSTLSSKTNNGVDLSIPRFSFDYNLNLKNYLMQLGIKDAFDRNIADFSNMTNNTNGLYVDDAIHKANIDFSEKGIKAAAVTIITLNAGSVINETKPEEIIINKPFLYVIRDKNTNEIWFIGTVYEPNLWENDKVNYILDKHF